MESLIFLLVFMSGVLIAWYSFNKFLVGVTVPEGPKIVKEVHIPEFVYKEIETQVKDALLELYYVDRCFDIDFGDYVIEVWLAVTCDVRETTGGSDEHGNYEQLVYEAGRDCEVYRWRVYNVYDENKGFLSDFNSGKLEQMIENY
jgi:hypothetical protein